MAALKEENEEKIHYFISFSFNQRPHSTWPPEKLKWKVVVYAFRKKCIVIVESTTDNIGTGKADLG